jgi:hypothetical protein
MLFHSSPELAETVAAERNREFTACAIPVLTVLSARGSREVLQLTQHSMLGNSMTLPTSSKILLFKCTPYRTFVQASSWCKRSLFTYAD